MAAKKKKKTSDYVIAAALMAFLFLGLKGGGGEKGSGANVEAGTEGNDGASGGDKDKVTLALRLATPTQFWHVKSSKGRDLHDKVALAFPDVEDSYQGRDHVIFGKTPADANSLDRLLSVLPVLFNLFDVEQFLLEVDVGYNAMSYEQAIGRVTSALRQIPAADNLSVNFQALG